MKLFQDEPTNARDHAEAVGNDTVGHEQPADQRGADELELKADGAVGEQACEGQVHHRDACRCGEVITAPQVALGKFHCLLLQLWRLAKGTAYPFLDPFVNRDPNSKRLNGGVYGCLEPDFLGFLEEGKEVFRRY